MKKITKRLTSCALALLMLVGMLPMGPVVEAKADTTSYVFDATTIDATGVADKDPVAEGTMYVDGYFKTIGTVTQRLTSEGTTRALEIGKNLTGALQFTTNGTASVTITASSTGGSNTSEIALIDANGAVVANNEGLTQVSTTASTTLTYTGLAAGTYQIVSPENADLNRGFRLIGVTVEEEAAAAGGTVVEHLLDVTTLDATGVTDKDAVAEGTAYADDYYKVIGKVTQRLTGEGTMKALEISKNLTGALQFTTAGTADVTLVVSSTGGSNTSEVALIDANGAVVANNEGLTQVSTTAATTLTYTGLAAGTYQIVSPENADLNRGFRLMSVNVAEVSGGASTTEYLLDVTTLDATGVTDKDAVAAGTAYAEDYYKVVGTVTQRTTSEGTMKALEIAKNLTGALQFTVSGTADVTVVVSSTGGSNTSEVAIIDANGAVVANNEGLTQVSTTAATTLTYTGLTAGTYQLVSPENKDLNRGFRVMSISTVQTTSGARPSRAAWDSVAAPVITNATQSGGSINVNYQMVIGYDGADKVSMEMLDAAGNVLATDGEASDSTGGVISFSPASTGSYSFRLTASRKDETDKVVTSDAVAFTLPLTLPGPTSATSQGGGKLSVVWAPVKEAESYIVSYRPVDGGDVVTAGTTTATEYVVEGLTVGTKYEFQIQAVRGTETTAAGLIEGRATADAQRVWSFSAYGSSTKLEKNWYEGDINEGSVTVASLGGSGKIVPGSTDGVAFYYTTIDPEKENFKLRGKISVDEWQLSNGQDGFGMMVADAVGINGDSSAFWNNYFSAVVSKVEYWWDYEKNEVVTGDTGTANKISMKLGVGTQEKRGVTAANVADGTIVTNVNELFYTDTQPLEYSQRFAAGTYNIVGNYTGNKPTGTVGDKALKTEFIFEIERNNTGYYISYITYDKDGNEQKETRRFYDIERTALTQIDPENIYVGFYAARNAKITVTDVTLTTSDPATDAPAEEREITYYAPELAVNSAETTGNDDYVLNIYTNANGTLDVKGNNGEVYAEGVKATAETYTYITVEDLPAGLTNFRIFFTPDADFKFSEYEMLSTYDTTEIQWAVSKKVFDMDVIYVAPNVDPSYTGKGTKDNPTDLNNAMEYAKEGQIIVLAEGTYKEFLSTITVGRGNDGTAENPIILMADPEAATRPVLDFDGKGSGMTIAGDYWILDGFDVTNSKDASKGITISGSNCIVQNVNTYKNGNSGINIGRWKGQDLWDEWPANNLILNCTSWDNADKGYEDADGFACKLTVAEGNTFVGCIAHHNADDGWDLFAKIESGSIGSVTLINCVAYENGYLTDGTNAGNGNGLKLGGDSMPGNHKLYNCVAFDNKAKGIDSNSGPNIELYNCTSFNNGGSNVALYSSYANTAYVVDGLVSFRTDGLDVAENIKPKGNQDESKIYGANNYFYNADTQAALNSEGKQADASWFTNLDSTTDILTRNADGSINMNGFLQLTETAAAGTGAVMNTTTAAGAEVAIATVDYAPTLAIAQAADAARVTPTPEPTATPVPTEAPEATATPVPTEAPAATEAPEATTAPTEAPAGGEDDVDADTSSPSMVGIIVVVVIAVVAVAAVAVAAVLAKKKKANK